LTGSTGATGPTGPTGAAGSADAWGRLGNAGTIPNTNFIGTIDAQPFVVRTANVQSLRIEPTNILFNGTPITANLIAGSSANSVTAGVRGATISGGGVPAGSNDPDFGAGFPNRVTDSYGTVSGGAANQAGDGTGSTSSAGGATVSGGYGNNALGGLSTVSGGFSNNASANNSTVSGGLINTASGLGGTVSGGNSNSASGGNSTASGGISNTASGSNSTASGGSSNSALGSNSTVGGGASNTASGGNSTVGGGGSNIASGIISTANGGLSNTASGEASTASGGASNNASAAHSTASGGSSNNASGGFSTASGGESNNASGNSSTVGGGGFNAATGVSSTVSGGRSNCAGGDYSWAGGRSAGIRPGNGVGDGTCVASSGDADGDNGTFVWSDDQAIDFTSTGPRQFLVRAAGGMAINTNTPAANAALTVNGNVAVATTGTVSFGAQGRQMLNLFNNTYGIGVQTSRMYFRTNNGFSWFEDGVHSDATDNPGAGGNLHMRLSTDGQLQTTTGTISSLSDARLKDQVQDYTQALDQINALRPVHYHYRDAGKAAFQPEGLHLGFLAQEMQQVFPEWVSEGEDGYLMLSMRGFEAVAVRAMQELSAENAELRARLEAIEARLDMR